MSSQYKMIQIISEKTKVHLPLPCGYTATCRNIPLPVKNNLSEEGLINHICVCPDQDC